MSEERDVARERAVALRYCAELPAPFVVAKATGRAALRLEGIAAEAGLPLIRNEALTEALYPIDIGNSIPEAYFESVAKIFAFIASIEEA